MTKLDSGRNEMMARRILVAATTLMHFPSYGVVVDDITLTQRNVVAPGGFVGGFFPTAAPR
jgi:hypothetical protein